MITDMRVMVALAILFLMAYAWISLLTRLLSGSSPLPLEPRRATPWGWIAIVLSFLLLLGSQMVVGAALGVRPDAEPTAAQTELLLRWTAVAIMAATAMSIGLIYLFTRADRADFGISLGHVPQDVAIGIYAFLILAPITFAIQYLFVFVLEIESRHPLIELLKEDSTGKLFGIVTLLAVVVAPISEEYFFRVLLQGWLERVFRFPARGYAEVEEGFYADPAGTGGDETPAAAELGRALAPLLNHAADHSANVASASLLPIVISAAIFALMHWSHGPDPAALFVLALGLGYLYQRTHRWLPSVVTHACLNGTTMLMLWFGLDQLPT